LIFPILIAFFVFLFKFEDMQSYSYKELGERIRGLRKSAGLTQGDIASECHTSQSAISAIEKGDTRPGIDFLVWLSGRLNISLEKIITGEEPHGTIPPEPNGSYGASRQVKQASLMLGWLEKNDPELATGLCADITDAYIHLHNVEAGDAPPIEDEIDLMRQVVEEIQAQGGAPLDVQAQVVAEVCTQAKGNGMDRERISRIIREALRKGLR
jgi:transcriptional regulator with XRE-family HTH domain